MNVSKNLHWCFKLNKWLFIFKAFLNLFDKEINHFVRQVNEGYTLGILLPITDDFMVEVVDDDVHDEHHLVVQILFGDVSYGLLELPPPFFLNV